MSDFTLDADPLIPSGVPATPIQVGLLILDQIMPADKIDALVPEQQPTPEDFGQAAVISPIPTAEAVAILEDAGLTVTVPEPEGL